MAGGDDGGGRRMRRGRERGKGEDVQGGRREGDGGKRGSVGGRGGSGHTTLGHEWFSKNATAYQINWSF